MIGRWISTATGPNLPDLCAFTMPSSSASRFACR
jgi:hypothetical protein